MEKITLLLFLIFITISNAQEVVIDRPDNTLLGVVSALGNNGNGIFIGDQFELTDDTTLGTIQVIGSNSTEQELGDLILALNVFIYTDEGGLPAGDPTLTGTGIVELSNIDLANVIVTEDEAGESNFVINMTDANGGSQITLSPGTYWLVAFPSLNSDVSDEERWNWSISDATPAVQPVLIDPSDSIGAGVTSWTNITSLLNNGLNLTGMAWVLTTEEVLSTEENILSESITIFPNPTAGDLNINFSKNFETTNINIININGQTVINTTADGIGNRTIDTNNLATGVYFAQLSNDVGTTTIKFIKN